MNIAIDVIAAFNTLGDIKPLYVRLEDENHKLQDYKLSIISSKSERYSGIETFAFKCTYTDYDLVVKEITIKYHIAAHKWVMVT